MLQEGTQEIRGPQLQSSSADKRATRVPFRAQVVPLSYC